MSIINVIFFCVWENAYLFSFIIAENCHPDNIIQYCRLKKYNAILFKRETANNGRNADFAKTDSIVCNICPAMFSQK